MCGLDVTVYADVSVPYLDDDVRDGVSTLLGHGWSPATFRAGTVLATAAVRGEVVGCALARRSPGVPPVPPPPGVRALGPDRWDEWLAGGLEVTGVAVTGDRRRRGVGAAVLDAVVVPGRRRGGWAQLCGQGVVHTGPWLRRRGWVTVAADRDGAGAVMLDPRHPALRPRDRRVTSGTAADCSPPRSTSWPPWPPRRASG